MGFWFKWHRIQNETTKNRCQWNATCTVNSTSRPSCQTLTYGSYVCQTAVTRHLIHRCKTSDRIKCDPASLSKKAEGLRQAREATRKIRKQPGGRKRLTSSRLGVKPKPYDLNSTSYARGGFKICNPKAVPTWASA